MAVDGSGLWLLPAGLFLVALLWLLRGHFLARERRTLFGAIAALGAATEARLAQRTRWPARRVRRALAGLVRRGFVEQAGDGFRVRR